MRNQLEAARQQAREAAAAAMGLRNELAAAQVTQAAAEADAAELRQADAARRAAWPLWRRLREAMSDGRQGRMEPITDAFIGRSAISIALSELTELSRRAASGGRVLTVSGRVDRLGREGGVMAKDVAGQGRLHSFVARLRSRLPPSRTITENRQPVSYRDDMLGAAQCHVARRGVIERNKSH